MLNWPRNSENEIKIGKKNYEIVFESVHQLLMVLFSFCLKLPDVDYKPIDPAALRLPAPQPPSERLLAAVEAFYSPPSHERPRNRLAIP